MEIPALDTILPLTRSLRSTNQVREVRAVLTPEQMEEIDRSVRLHEETEEANKLAARIKHLAVKMGKRYSPELATFARYRVFCHEQKPVFQAVCDLADDPESAGNLLMFGTVGTGKDHLLAAALYEVVRVGMTASWVNGQDLYSRFRDIMDSGRSEESLIAQYTAPAVLGISDPIPAVLDPKKPLAWRTELLMRVVDGRYRDMKPTWITCNAKSAEDAADKLSEPVWDRLRHDAIVLPCFWPSARSERA